MIGMKPSITPEASIVLENGAEISAFHRRHRLALVVNGSDQLDVVSYADFSAPQVQQSLHLHGTANSVDVTADGLIAVATARAGSHRGWIEWFQIQADGSIERAGRIRAGNLPDSLAFSPDGSKLVVADEGEPNSFYGTDDGRDPKGSISLVHVNRSAPSSSEVTSLGFGSYTRRQLNDLGLRLSGPDGTRVARDIEPEFVSISRDGRTAHVTLQENNGIATIDLETAGISALFSAGIQDYSKAGRVDTSDADDAYRPRQRELLGLNMPDGISSYEAKGKTYLITANEGDTRTRPDAVNFTAPADGDYFYSTMPKGEVFATFEDPLSGAMLFVTDRAGGDGGSFSAEAEDEFFITLSHGASSDDEFYADEIRAGDLLRPSANPIVSGHLEGRLKTIADVNTQHDLYGRL